MRLADNYIIPPKEYEHDPKLQDDNGNTVGYLLSRNNI